VTAYPVTAITSSVFTAATQPAQLAPVKFRGVHQKEGVGWSLLACATRQWSHAHRHHGNLLLLYLNTTVTVLLSASIDSTQQLDIEHYIFAMKFHSKRRPITITEGDMPTSKNPFDGSCRYELPVEESPSISNLEVFPTHIRMTTCQEKVDKVRRTRTSELTNALATIVQLKMNSIIVCRTSNETQLSSRLRQMIEFT
jgi:hypothetical protein